jgi:hypothetical protein
MKIVALALVVVAGCASTSDVVPTGDGAYMVSAHGVMGYSSGGEQKAKAFKSAEAFCKEKGKSLQTIAEADTPGGFGRVASGEVRFRCV